MTLSECLYLLFKKLFYSNNVLIFVVRYFLYRHCERSVGARRHRCRCGLVRVCCCETATKPAVKASLARKGNPIYYGVPTLIDRVSK